MGTRVRDGRHDRVAWARVASAGMKGTWAMHDAVVVGAGPAGASAAYYLAKRGRSVLLLDRSGFPRPKTCGDCLTPRAVRILADMGVLGAFNGEVWPTVGCRIYSTRGGCVASPFGPYRDYPELGMVISRDSLDEALVMRAVGAGARFLPSAQACGTLKGKDGRFAGVSYERGGVKHEGLARFVVAADGAHSRIAHEVFGYTRHHARAEGVAFRAYFEDVDGIDSHMEIYGEDAVLPGVGWVFPMGEGRANVGVGSYRDDLMKAHFTGDRFFQRFVHDTVHAAPKLADARQLGPARAASLLMGGWKGPVTRDNVALVGDAAALVNPLTGEGIMYALESGKWAAEAVDEALERRDQGPHALASYQRRITGEYGRYFSLGTRLIHVAKLPAVVNPGVRLLTHSQALAQANLRFWISMF